MARPKLHDFPPLAMLRGIADAIQRQQDALNAEISAAVVNMEADALELREYEARCVEARARLPGYDYVQWMQTNQRPLGSNGYGHKLDAERQLKHLAEVGIDYHLETFTGRTLTPSARIAAQKCVRGLESSGLVELTGQHARFVRLTDKGRAVLQEQAAHA